MEVIYHLACFGFTPVNPLFAIPLWVLWAGISTMITGFLRKKTNRTIFWVVLSVDYLLFAVQLVYTKIFKQPLLIAIAQATGKDALTNYWREALQGILHSLIWLILLAAPFVAAGILFHNRSWGKGRIITMRCHTYRERMGSIAILAGGLVVYVLVCVIGHVANASFYEHYSGFYDPEGAISEYGVVPSMLRDVLGDAFPKEEASLGTWSDLGSFSGVSSGNASVSGGDAYVDGEDEVPEEEPVDTSPNVLPIDFESLIANADSNEIIKLAEFMESYTPTNRNEYTGMFEGYNLIFLTAEGFSTYAVDEELTPTLYRLINSGFVVDDYYVPLWSTSTSDGEYMNLTGLIPDGSHSMRRSSDIEMPFSLAAYFASEGVNSYAFHNNSLSYYDRNRSHPNLGYNFQACKLGDLDERVWGGQVFKMNNAGYWPASDLDMMVATIPKYINDDRFHVYYMTISGHMNYNFTGNRMSKKHQEDVAELPYSEEGRAYVACNMELDAALEYLLEQLEAAGKLENTVICLSADHYPYAMDVANYEELAGKSLAGTLDIYRNSLILWNSEMETVKVEKTVYALDLLPTLLNLFGFEYDSRLYVGRDMLSDSPSMVIFLDRSFITDYVSYNRKGATIWLTDEEDEEYLSAVQSQVKALYNYAAGILNNDFYRYVQEALPEEYRYGNYVDREWTAPHQSQPEEPEPTEEEPVEDIVSGLESDE